MNQDDISPRERISALADGQLGGGAFARAMDAFGESDDGVATWHAYHVIGDALRSRDLGASQRDGVFLDRLRARIAETGLESPLSAAPATEAVAHGALPLAPGAGVAAAAREGHAANDAGWRLRLLALAASVAAVSVIVWYLVPGGTGASATLARDTPPATAQFSAVVTPPDPVALAPEDLQVMLRDPQLDELLAAHKQLGGMSALQMPAGFLRNATFDSAGR